jgi:preprotein translocase subunit SecA
MERVERDVMLQMVDQQWKDHLYSLDHLKEGIGLRGYGQRDPLVEYKKESFELFQAMKLRVDDEIVRFLWRLRPVITEEGAGAPAAPRRPQRARSPLILSGPSEPSAAAFPGTPALPPGVPSSGPANRHPPRVGGDDAAVKTVRRDEPKVGRNDPCPCGSGKKYKKCHGIAA